MTNWLSISLLAGTVIPAGVIYVAVKKVQTRNAVRRRLESISGVWQDHSRFGLDDGEIPVEFGDRVVPISPWPTVVESDGHRVLASEVTSGDPLPAAQYHRPNLGGDGNPEYKGGNYVEAREIAKEMKTIRRYPETFREWRERRGIPDRQA